MTTIRFYYHWIKLGREYWKSRHLWTLLAYIDHTCGSLATPARSVADEMEAWLADQKREDA